MRAPLIAAALLLATVTPPAGADVLSPLLPLVDAAAQRLQTMGQLGYATADLEGELPAGFVDHIAALDGSIATRLIEG